MEVNDTPKNGAERIVAERLRQIAEEGWTPEHDAHAHRPEELELAAACYAMPPEQRGTQSACYEFEMGTHMVEVPALWPFEGCWWKPGPTRERELEKAGALCAAAIDLRALLEGDKVTPLGMEWREYPAEPCPRCGGKVEVLVPVSRAKDFVHADDTVRCSAGCGCPMSITIYGPEDAFLEHEE